MQRTFGLVLGALALGACSPAGQSPLTASMNEAALASADATEASAASAGFTALAQPDAPTTAIAVAFAPQPGAGFFSFLAPGPAPKTAEIVPPGDFIAPENPPLPVPRPHFGDRPAHALAALAPAGAPAALATEPAALATEPAAQREAATTRSLAAYEMHEAGVPAEQPNLIQPEAEAHPSMEGFSYVPASFQVAGAPPLEEPAVRPPVVGQSSNGLPFEPGPGRWRAAYDGVQTDCFPQGLRRALDTIGKHFGGEVLVTSGARDRGRRGSLHRSCKAADVRIAGVSPKAIAEFARTVPGVNGVGTYRWVSVTHVDVRDERFAWRW